MSFSKAKLQRFNEVSGCAPPPGTYEPKWPDKSKYFHFEKSRRFDELKKVESTKTEKTPVAPRIKLCDDRLSSAKKARNDPSDLSLSNSVPDSINDNASKQEEAVSVEVTQPSKDCRCGSSTMKKIIETNKSQTSRLEALNEQMDRNASVIRSLNEEIMHQNANILSLTSSNADLAERSSSLQQNNIKYRLKIAELQDIIDCMTVERNQISMEHINYQRKLKELESNMEKLNMRAAEAEALVASELKTKEIVEAKSHEISLELRNKSLQVSDLLETLDKVTYDLFLEVTQRYELQNRFEHKMKDAEEKALLEKQQLVVEYDQKMMGVDQELSQTRIELQKCKQLLELEILSKKQKEDELIKIEERYAGVMNAVKEISLIRTKLERLLNVKVKPIVKELTDKVLADGEGTEIEIASINDVVEFLRGIVRAQEELKALNNSLESEVTKKDAYVHELELLIGPFREQLELYEQERQTLQSITQQTKGQMEDLALQHAAALGHQNHKQKIKHLVNLKENNLKLQEEINDLQNKLRQKDREINDLQNKLCQEDCAIARLIEIEKGIDKASSATNIVHISEKNSSLSK